MKSIELKRGALRCAIRPDVGGSLSGLWLGDLPVLRTAPEGMTSARQSALFALVPFSNRIANAKLFWGGEEFALEPNFAPEPHAMHGIGWQRPWQVEHRDATNATLFLKHEGDASWPFAFECRHRLTLTSNELELELEFTNCADRKAPAGLGWHPYLAKRPGAQFSFEALARWNMDEHGLPTDLEPALGMNVDCGTLDVNHVYEGFAGTAELCDSVLKVKVRSTLARLVASTNPSKDFVALEPVTHATDAFNQHGRGTVTLNPREALTARMSIEVHAAHLANS